MEKGYILFFKRASEIYDGPGGYSSLLEVISSGGLKDGLNEKMYGIAKKILVRFLTEEHNTTGSNRIFGISSIDIRNLVNICEETEASTPLQGA